MTEALRPVRTAARRCSLGGRASSVVVAACVLASSSTLAAQAAPPGEPPSAAAPPAEPSVRWDDRWRPFEPWEFAIVGPMLALVFLDESIGSHNWRGGILLDEDVRDALRADSAGGRSTARTLSNVTLITGDAQPFFDAVAVAGWYHGSSKLAMQMSLISLEALAVTAGITSVLKLVTGRERPYGRDCSDGDGGGCDSERRYASFPSGHASQTFTAAALTCGHHARLPLYGPAWAGALACGSAYALAGTTATLRIVGDNHYLSDVVVGAALGSLVGYGLPWLMHYRIGEDAAAERPRAFRLVPIPRPGGLSVLGTFD